MSERRRQPFFSVIIPTYRDWGRLGACLEALGRQTYPAERFEVIVIDNEAESDPPFAPAAPNVRFLSEPRPGSYAARNKGIQHARGEVLAFTDSDCLPDPHWIEEAASQLERHPDIDRLAGRVELFASGPETPSSLYERVFGFRQDRYAAMGTSVTANMFARRRVFDDVGWFDGSMESGDDVQWGLRANARGHPLAYAPTVVVRHPARREFSDLASKIRRVTRGRFLIHGWHRRPLLLRVAGSLLLARPPVFDTWDIVRSRDTSPREKVLVLGVLLRLRACQWWEHVRMSFEGPARTGRRDAAGTGAAPATKP